MALRHAADKTAGIVFSDERQSNANITAPWGRAGEVFRDFVKTHVTVIDFEEKLYRALQPHMQASQTGGLNQVVVIEIA